MKKIIFFFLFIFSVPVFSQNKKIEPLLKNLKTAKEDTSKVKILKSLAWELSSSNTDTSILLANQALALSEKLKWQLGIAEMYHDIAWFHSIESDYPLSLKSYQNALDAWDLVEKNTPEEQQSAYFKTNLKNRKAATIGGIGLVYYYQGDYPKALDHYFKALKIYEELEDKQGIATWYGNIGNLYYSQNDRPQTLKYYLKALKLDEELGNKNGVSIQQCNIGLVYSDSASQMKLLHPDSLSQINSLFKTSLDYFFKALKIKEDLGDKNGVSIRLGNIGTVYYEQKDYTKAFEYYLKALKLTEEVGDKNRVAIWLCSIGELYIKTKKYAEAEKYLQRSLLIAREIGSLEDIKSANEFLCELFIQTGNYKKALEHYRKSIEIKDTLFNDYKKEEITRKAMNYEFDKKEAATKAEQEKKDALAAAESRRQKLFLMMIAAVALAVAVVAVVILRSLRITRKQKHIIELQKNEVLRQKELVEEQQKEIIDSINYAKRLQQAILPPEEEIKKYLPESFLLYKPKSIVAGDFYWMEHLDDLIFIAAADSTGHGVPGAMVSVVCCNALNRAVKEFGLRDPGKILDKTRDLVLETFAKSSSDVKDGMDISLCSINTTTHAVQWSGANNHLWYIANNQLKEITADKQPIGKTDNPKPFTTHNIQLQKGATIYLMTDGYPDQFGGPKGKKFKYKQLGDLLHESSISNFNSQKEILLDKFNDWKGTLEQVDDVTIIGIKI